MSAGSKLKLYWEFARPFTLLPPALGMVSGGITALGADPQWTSTWLDNPWLLHSFFQSLPWLVAFNIIVGGIMAAVLNAASNSLNQITDLANDEINKPERPIPSGRISIREAWIVSLVLYVIALVLSFVVHWQCFLLVVIAAFATYAYSTPPLRTKARGMWANFTIAVPRGVLLKVAGWSSVKTFIGAEPWYIGMIFGLFLLGASTTKDFSDIEGDKADGCQTLPIKYGVRNAAWMISPFFVIPFPFIPLGAYWGILTGNATLLTIMGVILVLWGCYTVYLILRNPDDLAKVENHPSWRHMYLMMMFMQVGFALAYLF